MSEMLASTTLNFGFVAAETVTEMARTRRADVAALFMRGDYHHRGTEITEVFSVCAVSLW
jgi:hypothetical protein